MSINKIWGPIMTNKILELNKNANNKVDVMYKIWLGLVDMFQTFQTVVRGVNHDQY